MFCKISLLIKFSILAVLSVNLKAQDIRQLRATYGENCNKTTRCDTNSFLSCQDSVCSCQKPHSMFYDPDVQSCLVLVGEKCRYQLRSSDDDTSLGPTHKKDLQEEVECVQNAWCNRSGVCMCADDYIELSNGTCISPRNFEDSCTKDSECRQDRFLTCVNGRCGCNDTVSTYNVLMRQCVGKAGSPCLGTYGCVYNADCIGSTTTNFNRRRMRHIKTCGCTLGYISDLFGFCKLGIGGQCSPTKVCADHLKCKDGQCVCKYENIQYPVLRSQQCVSLVGGPCNETVMVHNTENLDSNMTKTLQTFPCVDNAQCSVSDGGLYGCSCNRGFVENSEGSCDLAFGEPCNTGSFTTSIQTTIATISWNQNLICDRMTPLFCIDGFCQCESSLYEYNATLSKCLGKVGARCNVRNDISKGDNQTQSGCILEAECNGTRGLPTTQGICACSDGYSSNINRTCSASKSHQSTYI